MQEYNYAIVPKYYYKPPGSCNISRTCDSDTKLRVIITGAPFNTGISLIRYNNRQIIESPKSIDSDEIKTYNNTKVTLESTEIVNGYQLYDLGYNFLDYKEFKQWRMLLQENKKCSTEDFIDWLYKNTCTDWCKMNKLGECYKGKYWEDETCTDPYTLTQKDNFEGVSELPYPKELLKVVIRYSCSHRSESIKEINTACEWLKRMDLVLVAQGG